MREPSPVAPHTREPLPLLCSGRYEILKAAVHGLVLGTAAVCALYNVAAWATRRQRHLAINSGLYTALVVWEWIHVLHHVDCIPIRVEPEDEESPAA